MKSGLKYFKNPWEDELNVDLMNKSADAPLVDYIIDAWKSLEVVKQIKFVSFDYTEKESTIDINKHISKRQRKQRKKDRHDIKFINDDRVGKLTVKFNVTMLETDPTTGETSYQVYPIKKSMLIPLQDEDGYFTIKGKKYYMIYQLLEKSTYTSSSSVTLKSLMPIAVKRHAIEGLDSEGKTHQLPYYTVLVFNKEIPVLLFYMSKGATYTLNYLNVNDAVRFLGALPTDEALYDKNLYFQLSSHCYLEVDRELFYKYPFIQSIVGGFEQITNNRTNLEMLEEPEAWVRKIVTPNDYAKGANIVSIFNRMLDETTKKILKIPQYYKSDIYALLRWIMEHFNELRLKDNCDLNTKRIRCNEYIASLLTKEFSKRLNRLFSMRSKADIDNIKEVFKFPGDILIQKMRIAGILRFDDNVNDMSFWSKFKYTSKGPNSLGGKNSNNIGIKYRDLHPSMLGQIDILVCGNSDPGTSGLLSPFAKIDGLYFDSSNEPDGFFYKLTKDIEKRCESNPSIKYTKCQCSNQEDFYRSLDECNKFMNDNIKVYGTSKEGTYDLIINEEGDIDDLSKPQTIALAKKKRKKPKVYKGTAG